MNTKIKFAAALSALALAATLALPANEAQARGRGWAIGAGLVGAGIIAGSIAAANAQPVYVSGPRCRFIDTFDRWGNYIGTRQVCNNNYY